MQLLHVKALLAGTRRKNSGEKVFRFVASTSSLDRQGEVVTAGGWELANFRRNPVFLLSHNYVGPGSLPIGKVVELRDEPDGLLAGVVFDQADETARLTQHKYEQGFMNAVSVGFHPIEIERPKDGQGPLKHIRKELLEISAVAVPANPDALIARMALAQEIIGRLARAGPDRAVDVDLTPLQALRDRLEWMQTRHLLERALTMTRELLRAG